MSTPSSANRWRKRAAHPRFAAVATSPDPSLCMACMADPAGSRAHEMGRRRSCLALLPGTSSAYSNRPFALPNAICDPPESSNAKAEMSFQALEANPAGPTRWSAESSMRSPRSCSEERWSASADHTRRSLWLAKINRLRPRRKRGSARQSCQPVWWCWRSPRRASELVEELGGGKRACDARRERVDQAKSTRVMLRAMDDHDWFLRDDQDGGQRRLGRGRALT